MRAQQARRGARRRRRWLLRRWMGRWPRMRLNRGQRRRLTRGLRTTTTAGCCANSTYSKPFG